MTVYVGDLLTATAASVTGKPTPSRTWKWLRGGTAISGATSSSYTITDSDLDAILAVEQTETNVGGVARATSSTVGPVATYSPAGLFALAEPGVWYDPSDLTTLFQDTAGTTPVTTPSQTVALALDKSKGLTLGPELVTNGDFSNGTTGWTAGGTTNQSVVDGYLRVVAGEIFGSYRTVTTTAGRWYEVRGQIAMISGGTNVRVRVESGTTPGSSPIASSLAITSTTPTDVVFRFLATATSHAIYLRVETTGSVGRFDNISVRELPGFHATQATAASRPTYGVVPLGGRRNLLTYTEQFDNAAWSKVSGSVLATTDPQQWYFANDGVNATSILSSVINPSGDAIFAIDIKADTLRYVRLRYGNVTNSTLVNIDAQTGTTDGLASTNVGDGFFRFYLPFTSGADNNGIIQITLSDTYGGTSVTPSASKRVIIRRPQFELGSTATNYQRVGSAFDVTEAGVPSLHYLSFDGVDDFLVTPTITPGIDKAQVFAGVRKLSDPDDAIVAELGTGSQNGSFYLGAPVNAKTWRYSLQSRGTTGVNANVTAAGFAAPVTTVVSGLADISGDVATIRANGIQQAQVTTDQGTGNFLAYPLYIGRRGGTSLPFNGQLYSMIVRFGANLDQVDINRAERWVADKTGVTL